METTNYKLLAELTTAYYDARQHKRNTFNELQFELDLESNLQRLYREIEERTYQISPSICFIVEKPVKREIFAANFRDRVVHHFVMAKLMPIFENQFIYDSYSCRVHKGNLFGIGRLKKFIRSCSNNYHQDAFILKLDVQGFFMNINKPMLCQKILDLIERKYHKEDAELIKWLVRLIVLNDPTQDCIIKGRRSDWDGLPANKSLFCTPKDCGLPIGNLTSQVFANYYLNDFDHFMKETLKLKYYGRYVDDFFIVHQDKSYLKSLVPIINQYLKETVGATLHPKKYYLQSYAKGVAYLGGFILPFCSSIGKRPKGNFYQLVHSVSLEFPQLENNNYHEDKKLLEARLNSYLGLCQHYNNRQLCAKHLDRFPERFMQYFALDFYVLKCNVGSEYGTAFPLIFK